MAICTLALKQIANGTAGQLIVAGATVPAYQTAGGDATLASDGTFTIVNNAITFAKMQDIASDRLIGRDTAGPGDPEEISLNATLEFTGTGSIQRAALTSDVTAPAGSNVTTIANNAVTNAKLADMAGNTVKVRNVSTTGDPSDVVVDDTELLIGNGNGFTTATLTGDASLANTGVITIANNAVTNAKAADMAANTVKVRDAGTSGDPSDVAVTANQFLIGDGAGFTPATLSGDVTNVGGVVTIANDAVNAAKLDETDTYDFSAGVLRAATPVGTTDVAIKSYVDGLVATSITWKELALHRNQLLDGVAGGILQALLIDIAVNLTANDTFIITDGTTTETFTFKVAESVPFDVLIGGTADETLTNLIAAINDDSVLWSAVETSGLDDWFSGTPTQQGVIYRTAASTAADRVHGTLAGGPAGIQVVEFATGTQNYTIGSGTQSDLPAADPAAKRFGFGRLFADLVSNETHAAAEDNTVYTWDTDDNLWQQIDAGKIVGGTPTTTVKSEATAASAGSALTFLKSDAQIQAATATPGTSVQSDAAVAAQGSSASLLRADAGLIASTATPGTSVQSDAAAAAQGSATTLLRSDAGLIASTAAPGTTSVPGAAAAQGSATTLMRSDATIARETWEMEKVTTEAISGADTVMADGLDNTPALQVLGGFLNGQFYSEGLLATDAFSVNLTTGAITWRPASGTGTGCAANQEVGDGFYVLYTR